MTRIKIHISKAKLPFYPPSEVKCKLQNEVSTKSINFPKVYGLRSQAWSRFCFILKQIRENINLPKVCGPRSQAWPIFCLILKQTIRSINLPKACGSRSQAWSKFYLILKKIRENINFLRYVVQRARHDQGSVWYLNK